VTGAIEVDTALLALKIAFLALLYAFIWVIVRSATRDLHSAPQESIVLGAAEADALRARFARGTTGRLRVVDSPALAPGSAIEVTASTVVGRGPESALRLDGDGTVSSRHARFDVRTDGIWVEDAGSTNGTFVNGARVTTPRLLHAGDVVRIGETDLRVEA
jgi:hypothetical protein